MDVIALAEAGIANAVAPLGTALTEDQINELWRLSKEPFICFDGDEAGLQAAVRAADRALPILKPGHSLCFSMLPPGEDPDDLIKRQGIEAFKGVLTRSVSLADFIWGQEFRKRQTDTPERLADFFKRIRGKVKEISDRGVQEAYRDSIEQKIRQLREYLNGFKNTKWGNKSNSSYNEWNRRDLFDSGSSKINASNVMATRQKQAILAAFINHPGLMEDFGEALGYLDFVDPFLDKLRLDILDITSTEQGLEVKEIQNHLTNRGYDDEVGGILNPRVLRHAAFARSNASEAVAKSGVRELLARIGKYQLEEQLSAAQKVVEQEFNDINWNRLTSLRAALVAVNDSSTLEDVL